MGPGPVGRSMAAARLPVPAPSASAASVARRTVCRYPGTHKCARLTLQAQARGQNGTTTNSTAPQQRSLVAAATRSGPSNLPSQEALVLGRLAGLAAGFIRGYGRAAIGYLTDVERRLETELSAVAASVAFMVGIIFYEYGVQSCLDRLLGDSPAGSLSCVVSGLGLVLAVKLSGAKIGNLWSLDP